MVLVNVVPLEDSGGLEDSPGQLPDHVGRPPEPPGEHDDAGDRQEHGPSEASENETGQDEGDHRPLVRLACRSVVEGLFAGCVLHS